MKEFDEFRAEILDAANKENRPINWRFGQAVFNYIDEAYGVARLVQFEDCIDCFYNDDAVDDFIAHAFYRYSELMQRKDKIEHNN